MKYLLRAVKYFFYFSILITLILCAMVILGFVPADVKLMFRNGYESIGQIAIMFAFLSGIYPMFGFMRKDAILPGETGEIVPVIKEYMENRGYKLESEEDGTMTFRQRSVMNRIVKMCEDRITFSRNISGYEVEGLRKEVVRVVGGLEYKFREGVD